MRTLLCYFSLSVFGIGTNAISPHLHAQLSDLVGNPLANQADLAQLLRQVLIEDPLDLVESSNRADALIDETGTTADPAEFGDISTTDVPVSGETRGPVILTGDSSFDMVVSSISAFLDQEEKLLASMLSTTSTSTAAVVVSSEAMTTEDV